MMKTAGKENLPLMQRIPLISCRQLILLRAGTRSHLSTLEESYLLLDFDCPPAKRRRYRSVSVILEPVVDENGWTGIFEVEFAVQRRVAGFDIGGEISPACAYAKLFPWFPGDIRIKFHDRAFD